MVKKVIIAGSRDFCDYDKFCGITDNFLKGIVKHKKITVLSGNCRGTDSLAKRYAKEKGYCLELHPADWTTYGKKAGPIRNREMVESADCVLAFYSGSKGTESLIKLALKKGITMLIVRI